MVVTRQAVGEEVQPPLGERCAQLQKQAIGTERGTQVCHWDQYEVFPTRTLYDSDSLYQL